MKKIKFKCQELCFVYFHCFY